MSKANTQYKIDFATGIVTITKKFHKESQEFGSTAFNMMKELRSMGMQIVVREEKERKACPTRLTYAQMEIFISCLDDAEKWLPIFEGVKEASVATKNRYNFVRQWFLKNFPDFTEEHSFTEDGKICHAPLSEEVA